jgi:glucose/arabinose dehydrogenase
MRRKVLFLAPLLVLGVIGATWLYAKSQGVGLITIVQETICGAPRYAVAAGPDLRASATETFSDPLLIEPVDAAELQDGTLLIALKAGALVRLDPQTGGVREVLDIRDRVRVSLEQGFLSVALHPAFGSGDESRVYFTYIDDSDGATHLDVVRLNPTSFAPESESETLFRFPHFNVNHMAADLAFLPNGRLLLASGDSGGSGDPEKSAQDPSSRLGKVLEIDIDAKPVAVINRAVGLRNPWKTAIEPVSGALWITDVGQNCVEEVSVLEDADSTTAVNFGWPILEGDNCYAALSCTQPERYAAPKTSYLHADGRCSIIGAAFSQDLFIFSDFCTGELFGLPVNAEPRTEPTKILWDGKRPKVRPAALFSDQLGRIWILDQGDSKVVRIEIQR